MRIPESSSTDNKLGQDITDFEERFLIDKMMGKLENSMNRAKLRQVIESLIVRVYNSKIEERLLLWCINELQLMHQNLKIRSKTKPMHIQINQPITERAIHLGIIENSLE